MHVSSVSDVAISLALAGSAYALLKIAQFIIKTYFSHLLFGNLKQIFDHDSDNFELFEEWVEKYGNTIGHNAFLRVRRVYTVDLRALNHVLTHSVDYPKPTQTHFFLSKLIGDGLFVAEGERHRKQRRVLNPAFGPAQIRELASIFVEKANELRDFWANEVTRHGERTRIDVLDGLTRTTMNIICSAGFNYEVDALNSSKQDELFRAFTTVFSVEEGFPIFPVLQAFFPPLRIIPNERMRRIEEAQSVMRRISAELVKEKKAAVMDSIAKQKDGDVMKEDLQGRDLLTLLIKANVATDLPDSQRLSDQDILNQIPTFLVAGHETTSSATTWCLYALTQAPGVQRKLREELLSLKTDSPTMDELNSLNYLDYVVRETLRLYAPVPASIRQAAKDDSLPLVTPYTDARGVVHDTLRVDKDTNLIIPIAAVNKSKALWGEDAREFKPERWASLPEAASDIPGVWSNILTFLGGPRACIGYRFSLVEMKALLFSLVRAYEFELAVPAKDIEALSQGVQKPVVKSEKDKGNQMPLLVKRYQRL